MYLKPLRRHLEEMEECDFIELEQRITALFHVICLVWANSKHYRQPARLIVLLQEISNLILDLVSALEILAYTLHRVCYGIWNLLQEVQVKRHIQYKTKSSTAFAHP